jgi:hypothetical protein
MVTDQVRRATKFRSQVEDVWVFGGRVDRHSCSGEQDEFTPFLCVNHRLRQIYIIEAHSVPLRPILWRPIVPEKSANEMVRRLIHPRERVIVVAAS